MAAILQGGCLLYHSTYIVCALGLVMGISGAALLIGVLTPAAAALTGLSSAGIAPLMWIPACLSSSFEAKWSATLVASIAAALVLLGPGTFSLDARRFGRREIIIPPNTPSEKF